MSREKNMFSRIALVLGLLGLVSLMASCTSTPASNTAEGDGCQSPLGFIQEGHSVRGYLQPVAQGGATCQQGELTCNNGQWSGAYIYPSCTLQ